MATVASLLATLQADLATAQADLTALAAAIAAGTPTGPTGPTAPSGPTGPTAPTAPSGPTGASGPSIPPGNIILVPASLAGTDCGAQIQALLQQAGSKATAASPWTVEVPAASKPYMVNPTLHGEYGLEIPSHVTLQVDAGATIGTVTTPSSLQTYYTIYIAAGVVDAHLLLLGTLIGDKATKSSPSEWGMGFGVDACNGCSLDGTGTITGCYGDGIYIGPGAPAQTFKIGAIVSTGNRRQGLTIDSVNGLMVDGAEFSHTSGTSPACGIDIEPDQTTQSVKNVTIQNCNIHDNAGGGIQSGPDDSGPGSVDTLTIQGNTLNSNGSPGGKYGIYATFGIENQNSSNVTIQNNTVNGTQGPAVHVRNRGTNIKVLNNKGTGNSSGVSNSIGTSCTSSGNSFS